MTQVNSQYPENLDLDLCNKLLAPLPVEAQEKIKGTTYGQMVSELAKPGAAILETLDFAKFTRLLMACVSVINRGNDLDYVKKLVVYNKAADQVQAPEPFRLPSSAPLSEAMANLTPEKVHLLHMGLGMAGEAAEMLTAIVNHVLGGDLDVENLLEEGGDATFYIQGILGPLGMSMQTAGFANMVKLLGKRYKNGYSDAAAQARADKPAGE